LRRASFGVTAKGVYFMPDRRTIRFMDAASADQHARNAGERCGVRPQRLPDDRFVVWSQTDRLTSELMLVDGFGDLPMAPLGRACSPVPFVADIDGPSDVG